MKRCLLAAGLFLALASAAGAAIKTETVAYRQDDVQFKGFLAYDDQAEGKRPGVLVVHEWWGLNDYARQRARQLAEKGYVAFAVDMYGGGKVAQHPTEARQWAGEIRQNVQQWEARALRGLEVLREQKQVDPRRLAAIGYCFGGSTVLRLAYAGAELKAVASFHGGLIAPSDEEAERVKPTIFIAHGTADTFIPEETAQQVRAQFEKAGVDYFMTYYGHARHGFTVPGGEKGMEGLAYNAEADRRSWQHLQLLLDEVFK